MQTLRQLRQQGQFLEVLEQSQDTTDPESLLVRATALLDLGRVEQARELLENLAPFADAILESERLHLLGWAYLALGDRADHHRLVSQAAQVYPGFPALLQLGFSLPPTKAIAALKEALARARTPQEEGQAAHALAKVYERLSRFQDGFFYASLARLRLPDDLLVNTTYAALSLLGRNDLVLSDLIGILEPITQQDDLTLQMAAFNMLADIYLLLGQPHKALEMVEQNIALVGKDYLMLVAVVAVRVYLALGMREKAITIGHAAQLTAHPYSWTQGQAQLALGIALFPQAGAQTALSEAIRLYGDQVPVGSLIAQVYLAEAKQEALYAPIAEQLSQWSENALGLYPPLLRAARQQGYRLTALGGARLEGPEGVIPLRPRGLEMLVLLLSKPEGWERDGFCEAVYGSSEAKSFKGEIYRLRQVLGDLIQARPWRVSQPVAADFLEVRHWLKMGRLAEALHAYRGPLLPRSGSPGVVELRQELEADLRQAVLDSRDPELMFALGDLLPDDLELVETLLQQLPHTDWRSQVVLSRARRLQQQYGVEPPV